MYRFLITLILPFPLLTIKLRLRVLNILVFSESKNLASKYYFRDFIVQILTFSKILLVFFVAKSISINIIHRYTGTYNLNNFFILIPNCYFNKKKTTRPCNIIISGILFKLALIRVLITCFKSSSFTEFDTNILIIKPPQIEKCFMAIQVIKLNGRHCKQNNFKLCFLFWKIFKYLPLVWLKVKKYNFFYHELLNKDLKGTLKDYSHSGFYSSQKFAINFRTYF